MSRPPAGAVPLTSANQAARALNHLRWRLVKNHAHALLSVSRLRLLTIAFCSALFWTGLFGLFFEGFRFLDSYLKVTNEIVEYVFSMFFLSLLVMLVFSTGIILYAGLFGSREAAFLLTTPAPADQVFAHKFLEAIAFSSWGFLLLGSPMMVAYGITVREASWPFYLASLAFLVAFVLIPGSLGAIAAVLLGSLAVAVLVFGVRLWRTPGEAMTREWMDALIGRLAFSRHPLLPSRWIAAGLIRSARGEWDDGLFYLMVTVAHAGLFYLIAAVVARDLYRRAYSRVQGGRSSRRRLGLYRFDALFHRVFVFIPRPIRLLILKDLRTFLRDPAQWSQFLIFFGLLTFYFVNIRRLGYDVQSPYWRNLLSFLNLAVTALILSTFTSRFIFPMLSLEGRSFWVLGLLPVKRESILWGKFAFASGISLVATEGLVVLSDLMLKMSPSMIALHLGMVAILCLGLSGISVGMGARLPNFREEDPSKIAAGFGGTLNLLVSLVFIGLVVSAIALPCHIYFAGQELDDSQLPVISLGQLRSWLTWAIVASIVAGAVATILPLRIGIKAFREMEF
jgi:ABC-2 type transport system permease protein